MRKTKYADEDIIEAVVTSDNMYDVLRKLGASTTSGATRMLIKKRMDKLNLSTEHFRRPTDIAADNTKIPWQEVLVYNRLGRREVTKKLRRAMVESGIEEICSCGQGVEWNGKRLVLQIEHRNGDPLDNRRENLEFLCPNCHSQTPTYCGKNQVGTATVVE